MMFSLPYKQFEVSEEMEDALNLVFILHADHEQNCSTTVVRTVGSAGANLYASIAAGICALWGPLHGGANQGVIEMLEMMLHEDKKPDDLIAMAKDKNNPFRLMGFGHRVYKTYDPRAKIAKESCRELLEHLGITHDPLLEVAMELEEKCLKDSYFQDRNLNPNVDYYTGIAYRAMGIPTNMFTVMFAIGRLPGWIAHWMEGHRDPEQKLIRPRQIYTGVAERDLDRP